MEPQTNKEELSFEKVWKMFQETDKRLDKMFQDTDKKIQDTDKKFKASDKKFKELRELFTGQWGKLIESLVEGDLINLLQNRGINVVHTHSRSKAIFKEKQYEIDIISVNYSEVVAVEVKTTLKPNDITEFINKLTVFKEVFPEYKEKNLYGAVAYLRAESSANIHAEKKGLFVIRVTGNSATIINTDNFKPKAF